MVRVKVIRYILIFMPYILLIFLPFVNREEPKMGGVPFLWFWFFIWAVLITALITLLYVMEVRGGKG